MTEKEMVTKILHIQKPGIFNNSNQYEIELQDSKEWGNVFSLLEKSKELEELEEYSSLDEFVYEYIDELSGEEFTVSLLSSLDDDKYSLIIEKV